MQTIDQALETVVAAAREAKRATICVPSSLPVGTCLRQGDVLFVRVPKDHPRGARQGSQVVTGETRGSRHLVLSPATCWVGTTAPKVLSKGRLINLTNPFLGALVEVPEGAPAESTHPEHGHYILPAGSCWQVVQQMDMRTRLRMED
jgi:hypothetical protein